MTDPSEILLKQSQYSGKVYHLEEQSSTDLDFESLREDLQGQKVNVGSDMKEALESEIHIPPVFRPEDGTDPSEAEIEQIHVFDERDVQGLVGYIKHNDPETLIFEDKEVLVLESVETLFIVFRAGSDYYLSMIGRREVVNSVLTLITEILENVGLSPRDIDISQTGFQLIEEEMVDSLKASTVSGYASPNIDTKVVRGDGYQNDSEYERETRIGNISGHQFGTDSVGDGSVKTVQISKDCLIRSYSKISLIEYIDIMANYVLKASYELQTGIAAFSSEDSRGLSE